MSLSVTSGTRRSSGYSPGSPGSPGSPHTSTTRGSPGKVTSSTPVVSDAHWVPDIPHMEAARRQKPWRSDPHFFDSVSVSLSATVKMFLHGTRGCPDVSQGRFNWFEVMGLLVGHFSHRELILTDSFSLPVAASEVECSMTEASQIYMANYLEYHRRLGKAEPGCVGWYHTHPGYSCFLSGIDVTTQQGSQRMQDPWVALVIDPVETLQTGQFSMKAFRTYPEGYTPSGDNPATATATDASVSASDGLESAPANRVKDFGIHAHRYYELPVRVVQSSRDAPLWTLLQQHFWPLSLSLTFPYAPATRTCHCCSAEMAKAVAALAARTCGAPGMCRSVSTRFGAATGGRSLLYQSTVSVGHGRRGGGGSGGGGSGGGSGDSGADSDAVAAASQQLLAAAGALLQVRRERFSLMHASLASQAEVRSALLAVTAAEAASTATATATTAAAGSLEKEESAPSRQGRGRRSERPSPWSRHGSTSDEERQAQH
ncbi:COP9 signalosome complex subunit 5 [Novymonas esmeraldas]|uniref:COP9 signalosome complex subunit 5 n=1 Tax=Novymonas esmeraldas TaxID=1808958 RepID=A0AAW0EKY5_9TRYP